MWEQTQRLDAERLLGKKLVSPSVVKQQCQLAGPVNGHVRVKAVAEPWEFAACKPSNDIVKKGTRARSSVDSRLIITETIKVKK